MENIIKESNQFIANTYKRFPIAIKEAKGMKLIDYNGKEYLDFLGGVAVLSLGHCHPAMVSAINKQSFKLIHISNLFYSKEQKDLANYLVSKSFADKVFFTNSGTEAIEGAIKLVRKYFFDKNIKNQRKIIAMENSFHGRSLGALSATGQDKLKKPFLPLLEDFDFVEFNNIESLCKKISPETAAVLIEPIQGEGGVVMPNKDYLKTLREICNKTGLLLIFDEIQTGIGRTGKMFAYEHFNIEPDIMTLAKGLGGGLPIGCILAKDEVMKSFDFGSHGSTFAGSPFISAVALEVLKTIEKENLIENAKNIGEYFKSGLTYLSKKHKIIEEVRGLGLILGLKLKEKGAPFVEKAYKNGFLINCTQDYILRFVPPLIIQKEEVDALIGFLDETL